MHFKHNGEVYSLKKQGGVIHLFNSIGKELGLFPDYFNIQTLLDYIDTHGGAFSDVC